MVAIDTFTPNSSGGIRFAFSDAFNFGPMQAEDLAPPLSLLFFKHCGSLMEWPQEGRAKLFVVAGLTGNVTDGGSQIGSECAQPFVGPLGLFGVGIILVLETITRRVS